MSRDICHVCSEHVGGLAKENTFYVPRGRPCRDVPGLTQTVFGLVLDYSRLCTLCMYGCVYIYTYICVCVYIYIYNIHIYMYICMYIYFYIHMYIHICVCIHTHTHTHTHTYRASRSIACAWSRRRGAWRTCRLSTSNSSSMSRSIGTGGS
jgi:hypothetical protein